MKELEQLLQSLEAQKIMRKAQGISSDGLFRPLQCNNILGEGGSCEEGTKVRKNSEAAEMEVTAVQNHVSLKIECQRRPGLLLRAIVALEDLRLTVLHLNITSSQATVLYSFNLKVLVLCFFVWSTFFLSSQTPLILSFFLFFFLSSQMIYWVGSIWYADGR